MAFLSEQKDKIIEKSMLQPVTQHALNPFHHFPVCGIDSLDLGFFVSWGNNWSSLLTIFDRHKEKAQKQKSIIAAMPTGREHIFLPGGKGRNYRFHLEFPGYHLFIGISETADKIPNVYLSLNAKTIWQGQTDLTIAQVKEDIASLGGKVERILPSRCDLSADFQLAEGLTYQFLQEHRVSKSRKGNQISDGNTLETYYVGAKTAPVQLRIYDKAKKVLKDSDSHWFRDVWQVEEINNIWRVEFQLRRTTLKHYGIYTLDDLYSKAGGIWQDLTTHWFTLRLPDNVKSERRTIHPWWQQVQDCAAKFGDVQKVKRVFRSGNAKPEWYIKHVAGLLPSFAAPLGIFDQRKALDFLGRQVLRQLDEKTFLERTRTKALKLGISPNKTGGCHE